MKPGRVYSLKLITADYQGFINAQCRKEKHGVSIVLENVERLPEKCFQHVFSNHPSHGMLGAGRGSYAWMNYHFRVFRAEGNTARLRISDWSQAEADGALPGGPVGQELMYNFIEVQPYLME